MLGTHRRLPYYSFKTIKSCLVVGMYINLSSKMYVSFFVCFRYVDCPELMKLLKGNNNTVDDSSDKRIVSFVIITHVPVSGLIPLYKNNRFSVCLFV